jgi:hypothetical protein
MANHQEILTEWKDSHRRATRWVDHGDNAYHLYFGNVFCCEIYEVDRNDILVWKVHCKLSDWRDIVDTKAEAEMMAEKLFWHELANAALGER